MPVGNSDRGVGLWAGQVMFSIDNINQYIDWWHEPVPESEENFDHSGTLSSLILSPTVTIGLTNYWNLTISQRLGVRRMTWGRVEQTIHHRDETTLSNFNNAIGGLLGDSQFLFRYLVYNDGSGSGKRLFLGGGLTIPSKNTLTEDPFFLDGGTKTDHRHFSMSEGLYKGVLESQFYKKRDKNPVFIGGSLITEFPLKENKYGYKGSNLYAVSLTALSSPILKNHGSVGAVLSARHTTRAYWNGYPSPNSLSTIITAGFSVTFNTNLGVLGVGFQRPTFLQGGIAGTASEDIDQRLDAIQMTISFRRMLDFTIPWIDPLKDL